MLAFQTWYATHTLPGAPLRAGHFRIWVMPPGEEATAPHSPPPCQAEATAYDRGQLLGQLERAYQRVTADLGVQWQRAVPVVLHPDEASLARYVGGLAVGSAGVYRGGIVHLVFGPGLSGPAAHELTHYVLDAVAPGRVPRWFQEGLAQLEELRLEGVAGYGSRCSLFVPWAALDRDFDRLPDEVAYGASLSAVSFLYHQGGDPALRRLIVELAAGRSFAAAVQVAWGRSPAELERQWGASLLAPGP
jgi:hypothetical protein